MKLNGWKRLGIIVSIIWIVTAYLYTFNTRRYARIQMVDNVWIPNCPPRALSEVQWEECVKRYEDFLNRTIPGDHMEAALVALVPFPFVFMIIFLVRWVRRGFITQKV